MNKGAVATVVGLAMLTVGLACGGGASFDNVGACTRYVEAMNGLECLQTEFNVGDMCPDMLDMTPCDLATYYDCMAGAAKCNGEIPDLSGQTDCGAPTCD